MHGVEGLQTARRRPACFLYWPCNATPPLGVRRVALMRQQVLLTAPVAGGPHRPWSAIRWERSGRSTPPSGHMWLPICCEAQAWDKPVISLIQDLPCGSEPLATDSALATFAQHSMHRSNQSDFVASAPNALA